MIQDGPLRKGKFLKKNSQLYETVRIEKFNFSEICSTELTSTDNPSANIIHQRFHDEGSIDKSLKDPSKYMAVPFEGPVKAPIIKPRDFTSDWEEEKKKARKRSSSEYIDEDDYEMSLEEDDDDDDEPDEKSINQLDRETDGQNNNEAQEVEHNPLKDLQTKNNLDPSQLQGTQSTEHFETMQASKIGPDSGFPTGSENKRNINDIEPPTNPRINAPSTQDSSLSGVQNLEELEQKIDQAYLKGREEGLTQAKQEHHNTDKSEGYKEGYEQARQEYQAQQKNITNSIGELSKLQKDMISEAQNHFYTITKVLCESVIQKEFAKDPSSLKKCITKIIDESISSAQIKISLSPQDYESLEKSGLLADSYTWETDQDLKLGQFHIESEQGTIRSNISKIVSGLLDSADINIFESSQEKNENENENENENKSE